MGLLVQNSVRPGLSRDNVHCKLQQTKLRLVCLSYELSARQRAEHGHALAYFHLFEWWPNGQTFSPNLEWLAVVGIYCPPNETATFAEAPNFEWIVCHKNTTHRRLPIYKYIGTVMELQNTFLGNPCECHAKTHRTLIDQIKSLPIVQPSHIGSPSFVCRSISKYAI